MLMCVMSATPVFMQPSNLTRDNYYVLTDFRLSKRSSHYMLEELNFNYWYVRLCYLDISSEKMAKLFANSGEPDQTPRCGILWRLTWVYTLYQ